jgi:hypothetical protein
MKTYISIVSLATCGVLLAGCVGSGYKKAGTTSTSLRDEAQSIDNALVPLGTVVSTLSDLVTNPAPDITLQFKKFSAAVDDLDSLANEVTVREAAMREQGAAYFQKWDEELAKIQNDDIQSRSLERKNAVAARFEQVKLSYTQAKTNFVPFMSDVKDIRRALSTDLTAGGIDSVKSLAAKANDKVPALRQSLVSLSTEFKNLGVSLSPATPSP